MVFMSSYPIETSMSGLQINEPARPRGVFNKARKQPQSIAQSNNVPNPTQSCVQHEDYNNTLANENLYKDNEEWFTEVYNPPTAPKNPERLINADLSGTQKNVTNYSHTRADIAQEHPIGKAAHPKENENFLVQNRAPKKQVNDFGDCVSASTQMAPNTQAPYEEERQPRQGPRKSKRYIPPRKLEAELFAPENNIEAGPYFDENYSELAIEITGGDGAKLLLDKFDDCKFAPPIMKNIENKKYGKPMPIQQSVIPIILGKHDFDMMGHAQTGSGKTAAYLLPIIDIIYKFKLNTGDGLNMDSPYVLILSPTRELANQLHEDAMAFAVGTSVKVVAAYGEFNVNANIREIRKGCDILCATTGRLLHFLESGVIHLDKLKYLILDEADKLLMDKFYDDIVLLTKSKSISKNKHTYMFSATFNQDVQQMARQFLKPSYFFVNIGVLNSAAKGVMQKFIKVSRFEKQSLLQEILRNNSQERQNQNGEIIREVPKTIIFVEQKRQSDRIAIMLSLEKIKSMSLNGDRNQQQRQEALNNFVKGDIHVLVATNVAARGLNIRGVKHVINYDLPKDRENYIHRIGRTGRVGWTGRSTSFFDPDNIDDCRLAPELVEILTGVGQEIPESLSEIAEGIRRENPYQISMNCRRSPNY